MPNTREFSTFVEIVDILDTLSTNVVVPYNLAREAIDEQLWEISLRLGSVVVFR